MTIYRLVSGLVGRLDYKAKIAERSKVRLEKAAKFLRQKLYEVLGVQAPRVRTRSGSWRATVKATLGEPPRRVVGTGQASVAWRMVTSEKVEFFTHLWYMTYWETHGHAWFFKTIEKHLREAEKIAGCKLKLNADWSVERA